MKYSSGRVGVVSGNGVPTPAQVFQSLGTGQFERAVRARCTDPQADLAGQAHRSSERHLDLDIGARQVLVQGREDPGLVPQAMGDGPGETEQAGTQGCEVDRVVVTGNPGVAPRSE